MKLKKQIASILILILHFVSVPAQEQRGVGVRYKNKTTTDTLYAGSFALVIGVSDYTNGWKPLNGVKKDVPLVVAALEKQNFKVETLINPKDQDELQNGIRAFIRKYGYKYENRLLIYFAGHGHTDKLRDGREVGYIVPADAPLPSVDRDGFDFAAVSMRTIENYADEIRAKHALFVFDSCFSGSLLKYRGEVSVPAFIEEKIANSTRQFITAGDANQTVPDESIFREFFVRGLAGEADQTGDGYILGSELANYLSEKVTNYSKRRQTPQYGVIFDTNLDRGDFVFVVPPKTAEVKPTLKPSPTAERDFKGKTRAEIERETWLLIQDSTDAAEFRNFLKDFKNGVYEARAKTRLEELVWDLVKNSRSIAQIKAYLAEFETGANAPAARIILRRLEAAAANPKPTPTPDNSISIGRMRRAAGDIDKSKLSNTVEMSFAYIEAGEFQMGGNKADDEKPVHKVRISQDFWMGQTEVTQGQWEAVMKTTLRQQQAKAYQGAQIYGEGANYPMYYVSWDEAQEFVKALNNLRDGYKYRLPTEAEWEYTARAGTTGDYAGNLDSMAWYSANSNGAAHPVGEKQANGWNLYDMHGNVWEWCADWYEEDYYSESPAADPTATASSSDRVNRGGSWNSDAAILRSAYRSNDSPSARAASLGFRVVRMAL